MSQLLSVRFLLSHLRRYHLLLFGLPAIMATLRLLRYFLKKKKPPPPPTIDPDAVRRTK